MKHLNGCASHIADGPTKGATKFTGAALGWYSAAMHRSLALGALFMVCTTGVAHGQESEASPPAAYTSDVTGAPDAGAAEPDPVVDPVVDPVAEPASAEPANEPAAPEATATSETAATSETSEEAPAESAIASSLPFTLEGWVEAFYSFNFNEPSNGITNLRGFDNRHNSFQIANIVLDLHWDWENLVGRIMLQWGLTPSTYYLAEPLRSAVGSAVGDSSLYLWQFIQEANIGYRLPVGNGLLVEAGLFISPIGPEGMAVHSDFTFSRSNLFFGLPFYHTGIRLSYEVDRNITLMAWAINGWNSVLDNNDEKSFALELVWNPADAVTAIFVYMSGVERGYGAPERQQTSSDPLPWRHMFEANLTASFTDWLSMIGQLNAGFEPNRFGLASWAAAALSLHAEATEWLAFALRGDVFYESVPANASGSAAPIFWNGAEWVSSGTVTVDLHPEDHFSFRIEYRHDHAAAPVYYRGVVGNDPATGAWIGNAPSQDTLTFGTTAWF